MQILFTASDSPLSRVIRFLTKEPVSHCAILSAGWVIHSNLLGLHVELPQTFTAHSRIVYTIDIPFDNDKLMRCLSQHEGAMYDFGALLYLGLRSILPFLPQKNLWQTSGMFLCTEWVTDVLDDKENSVLTPYQLYERLKK